MSTALQSDSRDAQALRDFRGTGPREILEYQDSQFQSERDFYAVGKLYGLWLAPVPSGEGLSDAGVRAALKSWWGNLEKGEPGIYPRITWDPPKIQVVLDSHDADSHRTKRAQLYFLGGIQKMDESSIANLCGETDTPYRATQQYQDLGPCYGICYEARKVFENNNKLTAFHHVFGEEDGITPNLWYDRRRGGLVLVGGNYRIEAPDAELGASPGIAN